MRIIQISIIFLMMLSIFLSAAGAFDPEGPSIDEIRSSSIVKLSEDGKGAGRLHSNDTFLDMDVYEIILTEDDYRFKMTLYGKGKIGAMVIDESDLIILKMEKTEKSDDVESTSWQYFSIGRNMTLTIAVFGEGKYSMMIGEDESSEGWGFCIIMILFMVCGSLINLFILFVLVFAIYIAALRIFTLVKKVGIRRKAIEDESYAPSIDMISYRETMRLRKRRNRVRSFAVKTFYAITGLAFILFFVAIITFVADGPLGLIAVILASYSYFLMAYFVLFMIVWFVSLSEQVSVPAMPSKATMDAWIKGYGKVFKESSWNTRPIIWTVIVVFFGSILIIFSGLKDWALLSLLPVAIYLLIYVRLHIQCDGKKLIVHFGPRIALLKATSKMGLWQIIPPKRKLCIHLEDIHSVNPTSLKWQRDYLLQAPIGIGIGPEGELAYVSNRRTGVRITLKNGLEYVISTSRPAELVSFIRYHLK